MPHEPFSKFVYVDENALQPGFTSSAWSDIDVAYADEVSAKLLELAARGDTNASRSYLADEFKRMGLDVHKVLYTLVTPGYPDSIGTNVYARARASRTDGRETTVLSASWYSRLRQAPSETAELPYAPDDGSGHALNIRGIATVLAMARFVSHVPHWSKDIVFVISDGYLDGLHVWAKSYFDPLSPEFVAAPVDDGGTPIWNALALDFPADSYSSLSVLYEGCNGQLPNLDTLNTVCEIVRLSQLDALVGLLGAPAGTTSPLVERLAHASWLPDAWRDHPLWQDLRHYVQGWHALLPQWQHQVVGRPSGVHGVLLPFHVDAITLYAEPATGPFGFLHLGKVVELTLRSFSNLHERLHHSQFFYLLTSPWRYIPIAMYILVPVLLGAALTLQGLDLWHRLAVQRDAQRDAMRRQHTRGPWLVQPTYMEFAAQCPDALRRAEFLSLNRPVLAALTCVVSTYAIGLAALAAVSHLPVATLSLPAVWTTMAALLLAAPVLLTALVPVSQRARLGQCVHAFAALQGGMLSSVLATLNFGQATALALLFCALLCPVAPPARRPYTWRRGLYLLQAAGAMAATPVVLAVLAMAPLPWYPEAWARAALWDWHMLGTITVPLVLLGVLPIACQGALACLFYTTS